MSALVILSVLVWTLPLPLVVQFILAIVLPVLVGLVTTRVTRSNLKAILLLGLSLVSSFFTELASALGDHPFDVGTWLVVALGTFVTGVALHYGLFKPTGVSEAAQRSLVTQKRNPDGTFA